MLCGKLAYPFNDLKRIHKRDLLLGWRLLVHTRIIHVYDMYGKGYDCWLKPARASLLGLKPNSLRRAQALALSRYQSLHCRQ